MEFLLKSLLFLSISSLISAGFYDSSPVQKLDSSNFRSLVIDSQSLWFIEFYAPWCGHCQRLTPEWEKLARSFSGIVNIGAVDMTVDGQIGAPYGIQGFPTLKFFGDDKSAPTDYAGSRSASDMISFITDQIKKIANDRLRAKPAQPNQEQREAPKPEERQREGNQQENTQQQNGDEEVIVLTDDNFEEQVLRTEEAWMVEFYAPWCGHCKHLEPEWNSLARRVKGQIKVGKLDATANNKMASRFGVNGYPTIKFFPGGRKNDGGVEDYSGSRDSISMGNWAVEKKETAGHLEIIQLINAETFKKYCKEAKAACLIVFLPHIYDSSREERNRYIQNIEEVQGEVKGKPLTFLWSQGGDQFQLEDELGLGSGYPAVVAISFRKTVFTVMRGAFSKEGLLGFTNGIIAGKETFRPLIELPSIKTVEKWDGEDRKPEVREEEDVGGDREEL